MTNDVIKKGETPIIAFSGPIIGLFGSDNWPFRPRPEKDNYRTRKGQLSGPKRSIIGPEKGNYRTRKGQLSDPKRPIIDGPEKAIIGPEKAIIRPTKGQLSDPKRSIIGPEKGNYRWSQKGN